MPTIQQMTTYLMGPAFILIAGICLLIWPPAFKSRLFNRLPGLLIFALGFLLMTAMIENFPTYMEYISRHSFSMQAN